MKSVLLINCEEDTSESVNESGNHKLGLLRRVIQIV